MPIKVFPLPPARQPVQELKEKDVNGLGYPSHGPPTLIKKGRLFNKKYFTSSLRKK